TRPVKIDLFTITPNPALRYVVQDFSVEWNVSGATSVQFQGIEALTGKPDTDMHPASGKITLPAGTPRDADVSLIATGQDGNPVVQQLRVTVAEPVCTTSSAEVEVRSGPGLVYPVSRTLAANVQV